MIRSKAFLYFLLSFIGGVFAGSFFDVPLNTFLVIVIIALILITIFYRRGSRILNPKATMLAFMMVAFALGVIRFDHTESVTRILTNFNDAGVKIKMLGYIDDEPQRLADKQRLTVRIKEIRASNYVTFTNEKLLATVDLYPEYEFGDFLMIEGETKTPPKLFFDNGKEFDYASYLAKDAVFSLSYYPKIEKISITDFYRQDEVSFWENLKIKIFRGIFKVKKSFQESIVKSVAEPNASFINGILLGSREGIPQKLKDAFNKTSTTHILAISGYNITIISQYILALFLFFMHRKKAFWFSVLGIFLFTIITGAQASVIRAAIMGILIMIAYQGGRFYNMTNSIVFAGALMILINPKVLRFDIGFQLSFLATLGLIYIAPLIKEKLKNLPEKWSFKENFIATVSAQIMVLPIILFNFQNLSLVSIPANVLILPVVPLAMLVGFIAGALGMVWSYLGQIAGLAAWLVSSYEIVIIKFFSLIPFASKNIMISWYLIPFLYLLIVLGIFWTKRRIKNEKN